MKSMLVTVYAGMPLWVWLLVLLLTTANEVINRAKWTRAQSLLQGICLAVLKFPLFGPLLQRAPVLGDTLVKISTPLVVVVPPSAAAAIQASVAAAQRDKEAGKAEIDGLVGLVAIGMASFVAYVAAATLTGLLFGGCAHSGQAFAELEAGAGTVVKDCGSGALADYSDVQSAIHNGGANWMAVVMDALGCIEPVIMDELRMHHVTASREVLLASVGYMPLPNTVSKAEVRRARIAIAFERMALATKVKAPK